MADHPGSHKGGSKGTGSGRESKAKDRPKDDKKRKELLKFLELLQKGRKSGRIGVNQPGVNRSQRGRR